MWTTHESNKISIPKFYENKSVLITGGTGFLGRLLIEKLLWSCPGINKIYVIVREKRGKNVKDRIQDITDIPIFDRLRNKNCKVLDKIVLISGDIEKLNFGLNESDKALIKENVSIFFHSAASVRFNDHLKKAIFTNTRASQEAVLLARQFKKCDVFVDVSTAYCNSDKLIIEEKLYPAKMNWRDAIKLAEECDEQTMEIFTQKIIYPMPNTYTFTKALAEQAVVELSTDKIPAVIARPSEVISTYSEPVPGWLDNLNGGAGMLLGVAKGVITSTWGDPDSDYNHVFADSVINALIIASWKKATSGKTNEVDIFNIASDLNYSIRELLIGGFKYLKTNPISYLQPPSLRMSHYYSVYYFWMFFGQILPSLLVDGILLIINKKPKLFKLQCKIYNANVSLIYFMYNSWTMVNKKYLDLPKCLLAEDVQNFPIHHFGPIPNIKVLHSVLETYYHGLRTYLAKEPQASEKSVKWFNRFGTLEKILKTLGVLLFFYYIFFKFLNNTLFRNF